MWLVLTPFDTMNTTVPLLRLKGSFGSISGTKLHWPSHKHSAHFVGSLSKTESALNWSGRTKCINWVLSTSTSHAWGARMALVKLDPWVFLIPLSISWPAKCKQSYRQNAGRHKAEGVTLDTRRFLISSRGRGCLFDAACTFATVCMH